MWMDGSIARRSTPTRILLIPLRHPHPRNRQTPPHEHDPSRIEFSVPGRSASRLLQPTTAKHAWPSMKSGTVQIGASTSLKRPAPAAHPRIHLPMTGPFRNRDSDHRAQPAPTILARAYQRQRICESIFAPARKPSHMANIARTCL